MASFNGSLEVPPVHSGAGLGENWSKIVPLMDKLFFFLSEAIKIFNLNDRNENEGVHVFQLDIELHKLEIIKPPFF